MKNLTSITLWPVLTALSVLTVQALGTPVFARAVENGEAPNPVPIPAPSLESPETPAPPAATPADADPNPSPGTTPAEPTTPTSPTTPTTPTTPPSGTDTNAPTNVPGSNTGTTAVAKASSSQSTGAKGTSLDSFRIIQERNIFNPNRTGRSTEREFTRRDRETTRRPRIESIALLGTISYEKGQFAFFDGSSSDYRKSARISDTIGGFTIASVNSRQVTLTSTNDGNITLPVGMQLQRQEEGKWEVTARTSPASPTSSSSSSGSGGGSDDAARRMMERRAQDTGDAPPAPAATNGAISNEQFRPPTGVATPSPAPTGASEDEILKRLMQRRAQENDK